MTRGSRSKDAIDERRTRRRGVLLGAPPLGFSTKRAVRRFAHGVLLGALALACSAKPNRTRDAAIVTGVAVAAAAAYRATGGCWAQCQPGLYCNERTGMCEELPPGTGPGASLSPDPEPSPWWEAGDAACPAGSKLDRSPSEEGDAVILCKRPDGTHHGRATFFYSNGRRETEGEYRDGRPVGVWQHWDEDGTPTKTEDLGESK
ncbi:MAG: hypothetical protein R3B13_37935 [Polyangiaceae bacterium]